MDDVISAHKPRLLDVAAQLKRSAHAALGLATSCVQFLIPVAGQQTHGTTFWTLKITTQVASPGAESAVYNCLAEVCVEPCTLALDMTLPAAAAPAPADRDCTSLQAATINSTKRQANIWKNTRPLHRLCIAYYVGSVNKVKGKCVTPCSFPFLRP